MTEGDLLRFVEENGHPTPVNVRLGDCCYDGWVVSVFRKRTREVRAVVEDYNGRLFVQAPTHIRARDEDK